MKMVLLKKLVRSLRVKFPHVALPCENPSLANSQYRPDPVLHDVLLCIPLVLEDMNETNSILFTFDSLVQMIVGVLPVLLAMPVESVELDGKMLFWKIDVELLWTNYDSIVFNNGSVID